MHEPDMSDDGHQTWREIEEFDSDDEVDVIPRRSDVPIMETSLPEGHVTREPTRNRGGGGAFSRPGPAPQTAHRKPPTVISLRKAVRGNFILSILNTLAMILVAIFAGITRNGVDESRLVPIAPIGLGFPLVLTAHVTNATHGGELVVNTWEHPPACTCATTP